MSIPFEKKHFRINPIELAIFAVVSLIFVKSGYSLLYTQNGVETNTLTASAQSPIGADGRTPASVNPALSKTFSEVKIDCDPSIQNPAISANKIRLLGTLCKAPAVEKVAKTAEDTDANDQDTDEADAVAQGKTTIQASTVLSTEGTPDASTVKKISIVNTSAKSTATVFPDFANQRFSTDYMSLTQGQNLISVVYEFKDGKTFNQEFNVIRN